MHGKGIWIMLLAGVLIVLSRHSGRGGETDAKIESKQRTSATPSQGVTERPVEPPTPLPSDHPPLASGQASRSARQWEELFRERRQWWSFQAAVRPRLPSTHFPDGSTSAVDQFIRARLESKGLKPAPPANPETWLRRVFFDVIGLPPSPEELLAFLNDRSPDAREKVLDRLLSSPHFGERWARHWMDLVRFAETYGHEQDFDIPYAWQYRDYLIRAFNQDVPYAQFVREHIAGDLLNPPRRHPTEGFNESVIGTGFWYLHQATHAPVDPYQDEGDRIDNQIDVFSKTFLGLTVGCARCHDHKFDAISMRDYYSLSAFLRGSRQDIAYVDPHGSLESRVQRLQADHRAAGETLRSLLRRGRQEGGPRLADYFIVAAHALPSLTHTNPNSGSVPSTVIDSKQARERRLDSKVLEKWLAILSSPEVRKSAHPFHPWILAIDRANAVDATKADLTKTNQTKVPALEPSAPEPSLASVYQPFSSLRLQDWFRSGHAFPSTPGIMAPWRSVGGELDFLRLGVLHSAELTAAAQGTLRSPTFTISHTNIHLRLAGSASQVRLIISRYGLREFNPLLFESSFIDVNTAGTYRWYSIKSGLERHQGRPAYLELIDAGNGFLAMDQLLFSNNPQPPADIGHPAGDSNHPLSIPELAVRLETLAQGALEDWIAGTNTGVPVEMLSWLSQSGLVDWGAIRSDLKGLTDRWEQSTADWPTPKRVLAMADGTPETTRILLRGDYRTPGSTAKPRFLEAVEGGTAIPVAGGSGRLQLADAVISPQNPLTYRVLVNRVWAHLFGRGLVPTVDNFGSMGGRPTHPELLDHLAIRFQEDGGSIKRLIRSLCLTQTYGMSSANTDPAAETADPDNQWLHRQRLRRLEGEVIRDNLLAVAGKLNPALFGPSVPTYFTPFMGDRMWVRKGSGPLDGDGRRSIYQETRRNFLSPFMLTFDLPLPDTTVGQRNQSNVPAQALALMNDPFVKMLSEAWGKTLAGRSQESFETRVEWMYLRALARKPSAVELERLRAFLNAQAEAQGLNETERWQAPAFWSDLCHLVFMLKEFIYVR